MVAVLLGATIPLGVMGKAVVAVLLVPPAATCLVEAWRREIRVSWGGAAGAAAAVTAGAWLVSSLGSVDVLKSLSTWARTGAMVMLGYLLVAYLAERPASLALALRTLLALELGVLAIACFLIYVDDSAIRFATRYYGEDFNVPQAVKPHGSAVACILPVILWGGWRLGGIWRGLAVAAVPLALLMLYGRGSQANDSAYLGLVGAAALLALVAGIGRLPPLGRRLLVAIVAGLILSVAAYVLVNLPSPPVTRDQVPPLPFPDWHRQVIWGFSRDAFLNAPLLGIGPDTTNFLPGAHAMIPGLNQEYIPSHPHNWVLEIAVETGLFGLIPLVAALLLWLRRLSVRALAGSAAAWAGLAVLAVFWVSALANFSIWAAWWIMSAVVAVSLPLAALRQEGA